MSATLTATPAPEHGERAKLFTLDCRHGTTTMLVLPAADPAAAVPHEQAVVRLMLLRHYVAERCRCTLALRRRYGLMEEVQS